MSKKFDIDLDEENQHGFDAAKHLIEQEDKEAANAAAIARLKPKQDHNDGCEQVSSGRRGVCQQKPIETDQKKEEGKMYFSNQLLHHRILEPQ
jgi:hypothetical protein